MKAAVCLPCPTGTGRSPFVPPVVHVDFITHSPRRIPVSRSAHIRGYEPVGQGRPAVAFESKLERDVIRALARFSEVREIDAQPLTVHYHCNGVACRYTPDLRVVLATVPPALETLGFGTNTLIEVKPGARLALERDRLERQGRAMRACGLRWVVLTDFDLALALGVAHERR